MLTELYHLFYFNKVKRVPSDLSLLTPLALAHLIMQDGSRGPLTHLRAIYFRVTSFPRVTGWIFFLNGQELF